MQFTISAATLLAIVSAANAQTAGFDAITAPAKDEVVPACSSYKLTWDYVSTYAGTVSIQLLEGATSTTLQLGPVIASGVDNSLGSYTWAVDCALGDDATYGIKITYDNDATGVTFQYSNPFSISKASSTTSSASSSASSSAAASVASVDQGDASRSTVYSTEYMTITSCAASVTDCPARSTVISSTSFPVVATTGPAGSAVSSNAAQTAATGAGSAPSSFTSVSPVVTSAPAPLYPAGNATSAGVAGVGGTVTLSTKTTTGGASAATATTSAIATAGAGRVAMGGVAAVVGLVAAVFTL